MRTQQSKQYSNLIFGALNKVEFEESAHPRDATGKFAPKGEAGAPPAESAHRNLRSLAREASALRAIGDMSAARAIEQKLQAGKGKAEAARRAGMPKPLAPPRPQPAPKPVPAPVPVPAPAPPPPPKPAPPPKIAPPRAVEPLPGTRAPDRDHEVMRINGFKNRAADAVNPRQKFKDLIVQRMNAIGKPEKMMHFGHALAHAGEPVLAMEAWDRLRKMGFDPDGRPIPGVAPAQAQPPKPEPPAPPARPVPPVKERPGLAPPTRGELNREKIAVSQILDAAKNDSDKEKTIEGMVRDRVERLRDQQNNPQKVRCFADELEASGHKWIAEEVRNDLWKMGYQPDGKPVPLDPRGKPEMRSQHGVPKPVPPPPEPAPPPPPPRDPGARHPMGAVAQNSGTIHEAASNFKAFVKESHEMGGGIGETHKVKFKDGSKAVYKPTKGSGLQKYHDKGNDVRSTIDAAIPEASREEVAYAISQAAGFDVVPYVERVVYPIGSKGGGHAMAWVDGKEACAVDWRSDAASNHPDLHRIAAMDFIMCNTDRHSKNFMMGEDGRYYAIDNGLAGCENMRTDEYRSDPHEGLKGRSIPDEVRSEIASIKSEVVVQAMESAGFSKVDQKGALARLDYLKGATKWGERYVDMAKAKKIYETKYAR